MIDIAMPNGADVALRTFRASYATLNPAAAARMALESAKLLQKATAKLASDAGFEVRSEPNGNLRILAHEVSTHGAVVIVTSGTITVGGWVAQGSPMKREPLPVAFDPGANAWKGKNGSPAIVLIAEAVAAVLGEA